MPRSLGILILVAAAMLGCGLLWQWLALNDVLTPQHLLNWSQQALAWRDSWWSVPVILLVYVLASLVMFPLSILVAVTGLLFGPWWGFGYALAGTVCASIASYWAGRHLGREALLRYGGTRLNGLAKLLAGRGIRTMVIVNLLPLAPFTLTNMLAGAFHLRFRDYLIGSVIGIVPGLLGVSLLGSQLGSLLTANDTRGVLWSVLGIGLGGLLLWGLKRYADRRRRS
ncbi:TVP38/TMEM64 family protein [Halomonas sp. WWR20]